MTSVAPSGTMTLVVSSAVCWFGYVVGDRARATLGMELHADHPVFRDKRADAEQRARVEELDLLDRAGEILRKRLEAEAGTELDLGALLVQDQDAGTGQDLGAADRFEGLNEAGDVVGDEAELRAAGSRREPGRVGGRPGDLAGRREQLSGIETDIAVERGTAADRTERGPEIVDEREVDPELPGSLEVDADDDRLDQHLKWSLVDPLDDLIDDFEVGLVVLDDQEVAVGHRVAAGRRLVAALGRSAARGPLIGRAAGVRSARPAATRRRRSRSAGDKRRRLTDPEPVRRRDRDSLLADFLAQERPDHRQQLVRAHVVELVDPGHDLFALE